MTIVVNNHSDFYILLSINDSIQEIKANDHNIVLDIRNGINRVSVKRAECVSLPEYRKMIWSELFGGISALFIKDALYTLGVSSSYEIDCSGNSMFTINIIRKTCSSNPDGTYDIICLESNELDLSNVTYEVENKKEIVTFYKKCRRTAHFWLYILAEILFTTIGLLITYPLLISIYLATNAVLIKIIIIIIPFFLLGIIALIGVLPMYLLFKVQDSGFYKSLENNEISFWVKKQ